MDPRYYCGEPDGVVSRREAALRQLAEMETCEHPDGWRAPTRGLVGDGACRLCGASATKIARQAQEGRDEGRDAD